MDERFENISATAPARARGLVPTLVVVGVAAAGAATAMGASLAWVLGVLAGAWLVLVVLLDRERRAYARAAARVLMLEQEAEAAPGRVQTLPPTASNLERGVESLRQLLQEERTRADAAERGAARQSEFLAHASHELRAPLTSILGYVDLLQEPRLPAGQRVECTATIARNSEHLLRLVNDILDLAKLDAAHLRIHRERCSLERVALDAGEASLRRGRQSGLDLRLVIEAGTPLQVLTDPMRVRQILVNLIGNAVRFTEQGHVEVRIGPVESAGGGAQDVAGRVRLSVQDTGLGLRPEQVERIFRPFEQGDASTAHRYGGTGLGLTISRRLARLLGGDISVSSTPGVGSCFTLEIDAGPLEADAPRSASTRTLPLVARAAHEGSLPLEGYLVMVVDDSADNRRLIAHALDGLGADVLLMSDGAAGVREYAARAQSTRPVDLVIMDMHMPELSGDEATRVLRERDHEAVVIALSASSAESDRQRALHAGCFEYLVKPVARATLERVCTQALHRTGRAGEALPAPDH